MCINISLSLYIYIHMYICALHTQLFCKGELAAQRLAGVHPM